MAGAGADRETAQVAQDVWVAMALNGRRMAQAAALVLQVLALRTMVAVAGCTARVVAAAPVMARAVAAGRARRL